MKKLLFWSSAIIILATALGVTTLWGLRLPCEVIGSGVLQINFSKHVAKIVVFHNNEPIKVRNSYINNWFRLPQKYDEITLAKVNNKSVLCLGIHTEKEVRLMYLAVRLSLVFITWLLVCGLAAGELISRQPKEET